MKRTLFAFLFASTLAAGPAFADVVMPEDSICKSVGSSCVVYDYTGGSEHRKPGTCVKCPNSTGTDSCVTCVEAPDDGGACNVGGSSTRAFGPWVLAGLAGAAVMLVRRRRG